jgi:transcriptional regulator with XRE-family HTH domain
MAKRKKMDPVDRMAAWLKAGEGRTQEQLGLLVGLSQGQVSRILSRKATPHFQAAFQIEMRLGIPARDWIAVREAMAESRGKAT